MESSNQSEEFCLSVDDIRLMGYEFSTESLRRYIIVMQDNFNKIFKNYIKIAKFISSKKESLKQLTDEIVKSQAEFLELKSTYNLIFKILHSDVNSVKIYLEMDNRDQFEKFRDLLKKRKNLLTEFKRNMNDMEKINKKLTCALDKISMNNTILDG